MMRYSIRTKLFAMCILLILLTTSGMSATYFFLTKQGKHRESLQRIQIAFDIIFNDISTRMDTSKARLEDFLKADYTLNGLARLYNDDPDQIGTANFIRYQASRVPNELIKIGRMVSASQMAVYGLDKRLLALYRQMDGQETVGMYVTSPEGKGSYLPLDDHRGLSSVMSAMAFGTATSTAASPLPPGVTAHYEKEIPDGISGEFFRRERHLGFAIRVPLRQLDRKVGLLVGEMFYTQKMAERYASLSKTEVNLFAGNRLSVGTLGKQRRLGPDTLANMLACEDIQGGVKEFAISSALFGDREYHQGSCAFRNHHGNVGAITVSLSKDIEKREIRKLLMAVLMISAISVAVAFGLTAVFSRKTIRAVRDLTASTSEIASGNLDQRIDVGTRDELETLARSFSHMRDSIKEKISDLSRLTTIMEATSDLVSMALPEARIVYMNSAGRRMVGWGDDEELSGKRISDVHPEWALRVIEKEGIPQAIDKGVWEGEIALLGADGAEIPVSQVIMSHKSRDGKLEHISTIIRDISERIRAEKAESEAKLLAREMELARKIQMLLLPKKPEISGYEITASCEPSEEVGGDYYDVVSVGGFDWIVIGDVSGHGMTAGLVMMMVQTAIHTVLNENPETDPSRLLSVINRVIFENIERMDESKHMTIVVLASGKEGRFSFSGLHEDILIWRAETGKVEIVDSDGMWIGLEADISGYLSDDVLRLAPGDVLVLHTDGLTEAADPEGRMLDVGGLTEIVERHARRDTEDMRDLIMADVIGWCGNERSDDMTLVIVKRK